MTYGMLRYRILSLLDIGTEELASEGSLLSAADGLLPQTVDATARKAALLLKCIVKTAVLHFEYGESDAVAVLPSDFISAKQLRCGRKTYGSESFEAVGGRLWFFAAGAGTYELVYFAYPARIDGSIDGDKELEFDDYAADIVAYGAAAELSHSLYPGDMKRFMRLATEFDERAANAAPRSGDSAVRNAVFGRKRGVL